MFPDADFGSMMSQCHRPFIASEEALLLGLGLHNITIITSKKRLFPCSSSFHRYFHHGLTRCAQSGCGLRPENVWLPKILLKGSLIKRFGTRRTNLGFSCVNQLQNHAPALEAMLWKRI
jgi:hypothetical protein